MIRQHNVRVKSKQTPNSFIRNMLYRNSLYFSNKTVLDIIFYYTQCKQSSLLNSKILYIQINIQSAYLLLLYTYSDVTISVQNML